MLDTLGNATLFGNISYHSVADQGHHAIKSDNFHPISCRQQSDGQFGKSGFEKPKD